jgi:NodT family efflux transporter outer membrane factor (OMF) lipoprotein
MMKNRIILPAAFILLALLPACSLLPATVYERPAASIPVEWNTKATSGAAVAAGEQWWRSFNDPVLDRLVERALRVNNDLIAAAIKVQKARISSGLTDTNMTPTISAGGSGTVSRYLDNGNVSRSYSLNGTLSYEIDLWGRLARLRDAGRWEAEATEADRQGVALTLVGTVATYYWQIAWLNQRLTICDSSIAYAERTVAIVQARYNAGSVSAIELLQAKQSLTGQRATREQLLRQRSEARNNLAILFDQPPGTPVEECQSLPESELAPPAAGLPASLLARRPDLQAAEYRLREYLANLDSSRASFYPAFTLTGSLGSSSTSLADIVSNPVASAGLAVLLPFLQWNTADLTVKASQAAYDEAAVNFRQILYKALCEVEIELSAADYYRSEGGQLKENLDLAVAAEKLAEIRYRAGATGVKEWLDQQESRRSAEVSLAENRLNRLKNRMKLYQALGGGEGERFKQGKLVSRLRSTVVKVILA